MDIYTIKKAYHWTNDKELEVLSEGLRYSELGPNHFGVQCNNLENSEKIRRKCREVANLIREIEVLNHA